MEWTGLGASEVLTTTLGFGAAVVVLYLLKLRRRQTIVPFVHLWREVLADERTTRLFSSLKRLFSLLVALAIVAALATALGDPRPAGARGEGRTIVVLVDASASMQATDVEPDRLAAARREVERRIDALGQSDRMLIAQLDAEASPLGPLSDDPRALREALDHLAPTELAADLRRGYALARDALVGRDHPEVLVVSDGGLGDASSERAALQAAGIPVRFAPIGDAEHAERRRNVAITAFAVRRYPIDRSRAEVMVELHNPGTQAEEVELHLLGDDEPIDISRARLGAGERTRRFFEGITGVDRTLVARLSLADGSHDALAADDVAYARLPERRRARVVVVSPGNAYLEAALLLDEYLDVRDVPLAAFPPEEPFDVAIFDGVLPARPFHADALYLYPLPSEGALAPLEVDGTIPRPFFDRVERDHPLTRFLALSDVNVGEALHLVPREGDVVVARDERGPLVVEGHRDGNRFVALAFDVRQSDLPLRVAWPLFVLNAIDRFTEEDAAYLSSYRTGEAWYVGVPAGTERATLRAPDGSERAVPIVDGRAICTGTRAGFYTLVSTLGGGETHEEVLAANLGPSDESTLTPRTELSGTELAPEPTLATARDRAPIWTWLLLGAALALMIEWLTFHRRWTV